MTLGINDSPKNTGTLPKSNRRNDRNREIINSTPPSVRCAYHSRAQHSNNLLDLQPVNDRESVRTTKNSNARSTSSTTSLSYQDFADLFSFSGNRQFNYTGDDCTQWQEMAQSIDSRAQSPPHVQEAKPTNVDKMNGDGAESEESLESQLRKKVEESQRKLAQLQEHQANLVGMQMRVRERLNEAKKTQRALLQQENHARELSANLATCDNANIIQRQMENETATLESETAALRSKLAALQSKKQQMDTLVAELQAAEMSDRASCSSSSSRNAERDKAAELESLKLQLAHLKNLMGEATRDTLNSSEPDVESNSNAGCCENGDAAEDEIGAAPSSVHSLDRNSDVDDIYAKFNNSKERLTVEHIQAFTRKMKEQQVILQSARAEIQRLKNPTPSTSAAPSLLLQGSTPPSSTVGISNAEKKNSNTNQSNNNNTNNNNNNNNNNNINHHNNTHNNANGDIAQNKKRQLEELVRKDQPHSSSINRDCGTDWSSRRGSSSHYSHSSTPANVWPVPNAMNVSESNDQSVDGISAPDNLLDIGLQVPAVDSGFGNNWWNVPAPPITQPHQPGMTGSLEYYRQLLMSSQAQQLQMMSTTMQQCCQLLWAQQRELQSMRTAITQLQQHFQLTQNQPRVTENENRENYSNLSRSTHHLGNTLETALPPSSSLPNLVSLPTPSPAPSHTPIVASSTSDHHHNQQQLNNQVPPGNRANNYWDNFRSYSRQNLLSGNSKTITDSLPGPSSNSSLSTNTAGASAHTTLVWDKKNRDHGVDNLSLPSLTSSDAQYSLNLQLQSNLQTHERESSTARSNISFNEATQSQQLDNFWEEAHSSFRLVPDSNDDIYSLHLSGEMREILLSLVTANRKRSDYLITILREIKAISEDHRLRPRLLRSLRALQDTQSPNIPLNETTDQTASESCQSSDEDSDIGAQARPLLNTSSDHQSLVNEYLMAPIHSSERPLPQNIPALLVDHIEFDAPQLDIHPISSISSISSASILTPGYNEDLAEADQSRPEASNNQQNSLDNSSDELGDSVDLHFPVNQDVAALEADREILDSENGNDAVATDNSILERNSAILFHR
ncbi:myb-like protein AA isoform X2 [Chelonus insularis]|uniref:myb-like protein AA isoform X2 n=1 Tax=Chelonus insularis TaxID=460826 RepID=UPI00158BEF25|nr:myb-like protein AA isoform X2 [Chelonus insularis]